MLNTINKEKFSSKERVLKAFCRTEPDRVPINYIANPEINRKLKEALNIPPMDDKGLLRKALGVDFIGAQAQYIGARLHREIPGINVDPMYGARTKWVAHETGGYWDCCDFPLKNADLEMVENWPMPSPGDFDYDALKNRLRDYQRYATYIGGPGYPDMINGAGRLRGMEQILIDLLTDDPAGLRLIERRSELLLEMMARSLETARGLIDFLWIGEDLGGQNAPLISLELFRKRIRPMLQRFVDLAKSFSLPVMIHSCGSSSWAFEDFIEMGIDVVDTLQPEAKDMAPAYLKKRFGDKLAFHGCISTAGPVAFGTPEEVEKDCRKTLDIMMPGGGYCFAPTHALQDNSPVENVLAMYRTACKHGWY